MEEEKMVTANINLLSCVSSRKRQLTPARVGLLSSYYEIRTRLSAETCLYWSIQPLLQALIRLTRYVNIRVFFFKLWRTRLGSVILTYSLRTQTYPRPYPNTLSAKVMTLIW